MINQVMISGYIGQDAKVRESGNRRFATFSVAHTIKWKDKSGAKRERTDWFDVSCNGDGLIDQIVVPLFKKGTYITVIGKLGSRKVNDTTYVGIIMESFDLPPSASRGPGESKAGPDKRPESQTTPEIPPSSFDASEFEDMPF